MHIFIRIYIYVKTYVHVCVVLHLFNYFMLTYIYIYPYTGDLTHTYTISLCVYVCHKLRELTFYTSTNIPNSTYIYNSTLTHKYTITRPSPPHIYGNNVYYFTHVQSIFFSNKLVNLFSVINNKY